MVSQCLICRVCTNVVKLEIKDKFQWILNFGAFLFSLKKGYSRASLYSSNSLESDKVGLILNQGTLGLRQNHFL